MFLFLALLGLSATESSGFLTSLSAQVSPQAHGLCLSVIPAKSSHPLASLLCGARVEDSALKELLRQSGLLHLFVVSGSHLIWLDSWLARGGFNLGPRFLCWALFAMACGWQAPVVRALIGLAFVAASPGWIPRPRPDQRVLIAGLWTLTLFPAWGNSLSLALSWGAAFALSLPFPRGWKGELARCASVWFFLLPLLAPWSPASPVTILVNFLVAPVFSLVLMPLGLMSVVIPPFLPIFDGAFEIFRLLLQKIPVGSAVDASGAPPPPWLCWAWIGFLHFVSHAALTRQRRLRG